MRKLSRNKLIEAYADDQFQRLSPDEIEEYCKREFEVEAEDMTDAELRAALGIAEPIRKTRT